MHLLTPFEREWHRISVRLAVSVRSGRGEVPTVANRDALWIIGTNGRVDPKCGGCYIIIDTTDNFEKPRREVCPADRRSDREPVTRDCLRRVLRYTALGFVERFPVNRQLGVERSDGRQG